MPFVTDTVGREPLRWEAIQDLNEESNDTSELPEAAGLILHRLNQVPPRHIFLAINFNVNSGRESLS